MYYIKARIQSIMFNRNVLQLIGSASKIIFMLKWHHHKQNQEGNYVFIGMWMFGVFKIIQIKSI
jgi:hypothetical protein